MAAAAAGSGWRWWLCANSSFNFILKERVGKAGVAKILEDFWYLVPCQAMDSTVMLNCIFVFMAILKHIPMSVLYFTFILFLNSRLCIWTMWYSAAYKTILILVVDPRLSYDQQGWLGILLLHMNTVWWMALNQPAAGVTPSLVSYNDGGNIMM